MGRHSAADDDEADVPAVAVDAGPEPAIVPRGRHARGEDAEETGPVDGGRLRRLEQRAAAQDERPTERIGLAELLDAVADTEPVAPPPEAPAGEPRAEPRAEDLPAAAGARVEEAAEPERRRPKGGQSTAADLALLRAHSDVRNRVLAAVAVPFVVYVAVLLLIAAPASHYLIWVWIPMVSAGVLAGLILDAAHRRHGSDGPDRPDGPDGPDGPASG